MTQRRPKSPRSTRKSATSPVSLSGSNNKTSPNRRSLRNLRSKLRRNPKRTWFVLPWKSRLKRKKKSVLHKHYTWTVKWCSMLNSTNRCLARCHALIKKCTNNKWKCEENNTRFNTNSIRCCIKIAIRTFNNKCINNSQWQLKRKLSLR